MAGVGAAVGLGSFTFARATRRWDAVSQTYDAVFHLNVLRWVQDVGSASPFDVISLIDPDGHSFYPSLWHALASLLSPVVDGVLPAAANLASLGIAVVVWPLGCVLLARQLVGRRPVLLLAAAVLSQAFVAFPWFLLSWGVLWPQVLGTALIPYVVAAAMSCLRAAVDDALGGLRGGYVVLVLATGACGVAHPGAFLSAYVLVAVLGLGVAISRAWRLWSGGRQVLASVLLVGAATVAFGGWLLLVSMPGVARRSGDWPASGSFWTEFGRDVIGAPDGVEPAILVGILVLVGLVESVRRRQTRWMVVAYGLTVLLDVVAATVDSPFSKALTAYWYNDRYRLAAVVPVLAVPLATLGLSFTASCTVRLARLVWLWLRRPLATRWTAGAEGGLVVVLLLVVGVGSAGFGMGVHERELALRYRTAEDHPGWSLVTADEQEFLTHIRDFVPADGVIAGTPWDGSSLAYALSGRTVLFPHFNGPRSESARYIADHLVDASWDPAVCAALNQLGVRWALDDGPLFAAPGMGPHGYEGLRGLGEVQGFTLVAEGGGARLYHITACGDLPDAAGDTGQLRAYR